MLRFLASALLFVAALAAKSAGVSSVSDPQLATNTEIACEGSAISIRCPVGKVIKIDDAFYGRTTDEQCNTGPQKTYGCTSDRALTEVSTRCNNRQQCSVPSSNSVFGDPCIGTYKYAMASYRCLEPDFTETEEPRDLPKDGVTNTAIACENSDINIDCPREGFITIVSAFYGRTSDRLCRQGPIRNTNCRSESALSLVSARCNNFQSCSVPSSNSVFSDPCFGTYKYAVVAYRCSGGVGSERRRPL